MGRIHHVNSVKKLLNICSFQQRHRKAINKVENQTSTKVRTTLYLSSQSLKISLQGSNWSKILSACQNKTQQSFQRMKAKSGYSIFIMSTVSYKILDIWISRNMYPIPKKEYHSILSKPIHKAILD